LSEDLRRGGGTIEQVYVAKGSEVIGSLVRDSGLPPQAIVGAIMRNGKVIVARTEVRLQAGDRITLIGKKEAVEEAKLKLCNPTKPKENPPV